MIDITTIQTFPVAPVLSQLQATNSSLQKNNSFYKNVLVVFGILGVGYIAYRVIRNQKEEDERK